MAQNVTIAGAKYSGVPFITVPKTSGGTAKFIDTSDSTVTPETLINGSTAYGANGEPVSGANPYELNSTNAEVNTQADLISQILAVLAGKVAGGGTEKIKYSEARAVRHMVVSQATNFVSGIASEYVEG